MRRKRSRRAAIRAAFTLMEVMLVLVIIAAIAGLAITNLGSIGGRANERAARAKISVLKGANRIGRAIMLATSQVGTDSSTIITRFKVPIIRTSAMPIGTWNNASRSNLPSGRSGDAASANGIHRMPIRVQKSIALVAPGIMRVPAPVHERCRSPT